MEALRNAIGVVGARWAALGGVARLGVAAFIAVFALVLISTSMGGIGPGDAVLFSDLDGDEEARIVERLQPLGLTAPAKEERAQHYLGMQMPGGLPEGLLSKLAQRRVWVSVRGASIRITPHLYNSEADIDRLVEALGASL